MRGGARATARRARCRGQESGAPWGERASRLDWITEPCDVQTASPLPDRLRLVRRPALAPASRHRPAGAVPHVPLDPDAAAPLYEQLYAGIREQTVNGRLRPGT